MTDRPELAPVSGKAVAGREPNRVTALVERAAAFLSPGDLVVEVGGRSEHTVQFSHRCGARVIVFELDPVETKPWAAEFDLIELRRVPLPALLAVLGDDALLSLPPKLVRLDAGDATLGVLSGMETFLRTSRPFVHVEMPSVAGLGQALTLLGSWGYHVHGQYGPTANLLCQPSAPVAGTPSQQADLTHPDPSATAGPMSTRPRRLAIGQTPDGAPWQSNPAILVELTHQLAQMSAQLEQQFAQARRLEAQLIALRHGSEGLRREHEAAAPRTQDEVIRRAAPQKFQQSLPAHLALRRKMKKLVQHPSRFFLEAQNPTIRSVARWFARK